MFDEPTNTVSYLVWGPTSRDAAVADPVLDFDPKSGEANVKAADEMLAEAARRGLKIGRVLETHVHADHLSAAPYIEQKTGASVCIGEHIRDGVSEEAFAAKRVARHKTLSTPLLLLPSIQVNMRAGHFPPAEANDVRYLKAPLKLGT